MKEKRLGTVFFNGILPENPVFRLVLGTCPTLAVSTSGMNGLGMGAAVIFVLTCSNIFISLLHNLIPDKVRIPAYIVVICTFVTTVQLFMHAYLPDLYKSLGIFIPLIVVNCIILARAEAFAGKNGVLLSAADGLGMGIGFTLSLTLMGMVRELIGTGAIFGTQVLGASFEPMLIIIMAPGGFIVFGTLLGLINLLTQRAEKKKLANAEKGGERA